MWRYLFGIFIIVHVTIVDSSCPQPKQYYLDCSVTRTFAEASQICAQYGMTVLNLTNSSHVIADINLLNETLMANNCVSYFWFSSGNQTQIVANVNTLGSVLTGLLSGLLGTVGALLGAVGTVLNCLFGGCPATTTPAPITQAVTICTRPIQQQVIQKCLTQSARTDMKTFQFTEQPMYGGVLDSFDSRSRTTCSAFCSSNDQCIGISYIDGNCKLYM